MDVGIPDGERGNIQTGGDRVSTISLLGCSTSVALATGPTDEEEEEEGIAEYQIFHSQFRFPKQGYESAMEVLSVIQCHYWCTCNHRLTCGWQGGVKAPPIFLFGCLFGGENKKKKFGESGGKGYVC